MNGYLSMPASYVRMHNFAEPIRPSFGPILEQAACLIHTMCHLPLYTPLLGTDVHPLMQGFSVAYNQERARKYMTC